MILTIYVEIDETVNSSISEKARNILSTLWLVERVRAIAPAISNFDDANNLEQCKINLEKAYIVLDNFNRSGVKIS